MNAVIQRAWTSVDEEGRGREDYRAPYTVRAAGRARDRLLIGPEFSQLEPQTSSPNNPPSSSLWPLLELA